jgi:HD-GYP domain-containing protein (c-di-GMP phosphodiesterase class II)
MILQHHERIDGSGYPDGLQGEQISIGARIIAVTDTVEAMASHRPYRAALGIDAALAQIADGRSTKFDPDVVDVTLDLFRTRRIGLDP